VLNVGNPMLSDLTGLDMLTSVGGGLEITNNDALTKFMGLTILSQLGITLKYPLRRN